jgi:hypothetical protein
VARSQVPRPATRSELTRTRYVAFGSKTEVAVGSRHFRFAARTDIDQGNRQVRKGPILLQKSVVEGDDPPISSGAAGFDPPALTLSTQLRRYGMQRTSAGGGRAASAASRRKF